MEKEKFVKEVKGINGNELLYTRKIFEQLKCGSEIEVDTEHEMSYSDLEDKLETSKGYEYFGYDTDGVSNIHSDGSLDEGVEICTNGRLLTDVSLFYAQHKKIFDALKKVAGEDNILISPRAGLHQHFVLQTANNNTCLETKLNKLIFKNLLIAFKNNLAGIFWLTSALYYKEGEQVSYTRYDYFHKWKHLYNLDINKEDDMYELINELRNGERYNSFNAQNMIADDDGFKNFHIEFRLADGAICPAQVSIENFMYDALIRYAIDISIYGELIDKHTTNDNYVKKIKTLKNNPENESFPSTNDRYSYNTDLDIEWFNKEADNFVEMLKPYLDVRVYNALKSLAEKNISLRLKDGNTANEIDKELAEFIKPNKGNFNQDVLKLIAEGKISKTSLERAVIDSNELGIEVNDVIEILNFLKKNGVN